MYVSYPHWIPEGSEDYPEMENAKRNIELIEKLVNLLFSCFFLVLIFSHQLNAAKVSYGRKLERAAMTILWGLSLRSCHQECAWRKTCRSYNYIRLTYMCELNLADKIDAPSNYIEQANSTYGQKIDWGVPELRQECVSCEDDEVCEGLENGTSGCSIRECQSTPPDVHDCTEMIGNMQNIGAKIKYKCTGGPIMLGNPVSFCNQTGRWTLPDFKCIPAKCWTPIIEPHYEVINVSTHSTSVQMHLRCSGNYITRGSPLICDKDGEYNFQRVCCVTPDQNQWVNIFSIRTAGNNLPQAMWTESDYEVRNWVNSTNCEFRRYDIISNWSSLNISRVKVQFRVGSSIGASIIFDGFGSTNIDWLSQSRLITSSWQDLSLTTHVWKFKLQGFSTTGAVSRFSIMESLPKYNICTEMSGWMMVGSTPCLNLQYYPLVLFAPGARKAYTAPEFAIADSMEILIELLSKP